MRRECRTCEIQGKTASEARDGRYSRHECDAKDGVGLGAAMHARRIPAKG